jgi:hypothetical protein
VHIFNNGLGEDPFNCTFAMGSERMPDKTRRPAPVHFPTIPLTAISTRAGKHNKIVSEILSDLARLDANSALKIDLAQVGRDKAALRSALHRGAKKKDVALLTASDDKHLYVFRRMHKTAVGH